MFLFRWSNGLSNRNTDCLAKTKKNREHWFQKLLENQIRDEGHVKAATTNNQHEKPITSTEIPVHKKQTKESEGKGGRERERDGGGAGVLTGINGKKEKVKKQVEQEMSV